MKKVLIAIWNFLVELGKYRARKTQNYGWY